MEREGGEEFFRFNQSGQDTYYLSAYPGDGSVNTFRRVSPGEGAGREGTSKY